MYTSVLVVTIWELGEAAGPLFLAPLSESLGRRPVINGANILFFLFNILAALSQDTETFIFARALSGFAVTSHVLNPAVVGDMFAPERRGSPMSLVILASFIGGAIGPIFGSIIAKAWGWRSLIGIASAFAGTAEALFFAFFRETYRLLPPVSMSEDTRATDDNSPRQVETRTVLSASITRPLYIFGSSGILMSLSLYGSIVFANFYNVFTTLPGILETKYDGNTANTGFIMLFFSAGSAAGIMISHVSLDRVYHVMKESHGNHVGQPEFRLPIAIAGSLALPPGILLYGWTSEFELPLHTMAFSLFLLGASIMLVILPLSAYIVDAFTLYSASALTAFVISRCLMCTMMPLVTATLIERLNYGYGFSIVALLNIIVLPIPIIVFQYGSRWRQGSSYTQDI